MENIYSSLDIYQGFVLLAMGRYDSNDYQKCVCWWCCDYGRVAFDIVVGLLLFFFASAVASLPDLQLIECSDRLTVRQMTHKSHSWQFDQATRN